MYNSTKFFDNRDLSGEELFSTTLKDEVDQLTSNQLSFGGFGLTNTENIFDSFPDVTNTHNINAKGTSKLGDIEMSGDLVSVGTTVLTVLEITGILTAKETCFFEKQVTFNNTAPAIFNSTATFNSTSTFVGDATFANIKIAGKLNLGNETTELEIIEFIEDQLRIKNTAGILTLDGATGINIIGNASEIDLTTTGSIDINGTAGITIDSAAASNFTTSGGSLTLDGATGINIIGNASEIDLTTTGSIDINGTAVNIIGTGGVIINGDNNNPSLSSITINETNGVVIVSDVAVVLPLPTVPLTSTDSGTKGQILWDDDHLYICINTDTWKRIVIETW